MFDASVASRFWAKVDKRGPDECWLWTGAANMDGYGRLKINGKFLRASHISLAIDNRPRLSDLHALHSCDNPQCVNPSHLRWGTNADNVGDMLARGRTLRFVRAGRGNPRARLTEQIVRAIRVDGRPDSVIAAELGVSKTAVVYARTGQTWSHVA